MTYTDCSTRVRHEWCPQAIANGFEWGHMRRGRKDRFDNLYRRGHVNRVMFVFGVLLSTTLPSNSTGRWSTSTARRR